MRPARLVVVALAVALVAFWPSRAAAHKFHASLAEVEYDAATRTAEISIRMFPDDLEDALARRAGRPVHLDATKDVDALALEYLRQTFALVDRAGHPLELDWVGMDPRVDGVWVFVEARAPAGLAHARVAYRVFFDLFADQVNTLNVKEGNARTTVVFRSGEGPKPVVFPKPVRRPGRPRAG